MVLSSLLKTFPKNGSGNDKYNAAYINALSEERDPKILFEWVCKLHKENIDLRLELKTIYDRTEW